MINSIQKVEINKLVRRNKELTKQIKEARELLEKLQWHWHIDNYYCPVCDAREDRIEIDIEGNRKKVGHKSDCCLKLWLERNT